MSKVYKARLVVKSDDQGDAGEVVQIEVGVPRGRLRATEPGSAPGGAYAKHRLFLITGSEKDFAVNAFAPSVDALLSGASKEVQVPGYTSADPDKRKQLQWVLHFDDSSSDEIEAFIAELEAQGCVVARVTI